MGIMRVSNSFNFEKKIKSFCQLPRFEIEELEENFAVVNIYDPEDPDGNYHHFMTIDLIDDIVQFGMPSPMLFEPDETIPDSLSTLLLKINSYSLDAFWCLEEMDEEGSHAFVYTYNVPKTSLNKKQFDNIVEELISGCGIVEQLLDDLLGVNDDDDDDLEDDSMNLNGNDYEDPDDHEKDRR